jgi:site-specific DNA-cytosine methylase
LKKPIPITAVGAYVSAGGFSHGVRAAGVKIYAHLTDGEFGRATLEHNFPDVPNFTDYDEWPFGMLEALEPDLFFCAPPCAPWSRSGGRGLQIETDPRVKKVGHVIEAGLQIKPKIWIMESVPQMPEWTPEFTHKIEATWLEHGYSVTHFYSNTLLHNTPQNRPRYHMIAHKYQLVFPELNVGAITTSDVLADMPKPKKREIIHTRDIDRYGWILPYTPQGARLRQAYRHLAGMPLGSENRTGKIGGPPFMLARLRWNAPCLTLVSAPRRFHPLEDRYLTLAEGLAVCGFNDFPGFEWVGDSEEEKFGQIAKGVLPALGNYLARLATQSVREGELLDDPHVEVVDFRPMANAIMRRIPKRPRFPLSTHGTMPHFKDPRHKPSMGEDAVEEEDDDDTED